MIRIDITDTHYVILNDETGKRLCMISRRVNTLEQVQRVFFAKGE